MSDIGGEAGEEAVEYECQNGHRFIYAEPQHPLGESRELGDEGVDEPVGVTCPECGSTKVTRVQAEDG
jgi:hypothetical protein